jgi:hypothetical protein
LISIRLDPAIFAPGGKFAGMNEAKTVLAVGTGKPELYTGEIQPIFGMESLSYKGGEIGMFIDTSGTQLEDYAFESMIQNQAGRVAYGTQIIDFVQRGLIIVEQNGITLTAMQIKNFIAP